LFPPQEGRTPLHYTAIRNYPEVAKVLLANGANVNVGDNVSLHPNIYVYMYCECLICMCVFDVYIYFICMYVCICVYIYHFCSENSLIFLPPPPFFMGEVFFFLCRYFCVYMCVDVCIYVYVYVYVYAYIYV
jgi:hypothetical protein